MPKMFGEPDLAAFQMLRCAFDPAGLANPGKVMPTPRLCGEVPGPVPAPPAGGRRPGRALLMAAAPVATEHPGTPEEAAELLRTLGADGRAVRIRGGGTKRAGAAGGEPVAIEIVTAASTASSSTTRATSPPCSRPGCRSRAPRSAFADDGPDVRRSTRRSAPATRRRSAACSRRPTPGPLRHRYGGVRDLVVGITVALSDGTLAKAGGQVIKNVAGYDLGKLFAGSFGTLGLIAHGRRAPAPAPGRAPRRRGPSADPAALGRAPPPRSPRCRSRPTASTSPGATVPGACSSASAARRPSARPARSSTACGAAGLEDVQASADDDALWTAQRDGQRSRRRRRAEGLGAPGGPRDRPRAPPTTPARRRRRPRRARTVTGSRSTGDDLAGRVEAVRARARARARARSRTRPRPSAPPSRRGASPTPARWPSCGASRSGSTPPGSSARAASWEASSELARHHAPRAERDPAKRAWDDHNPPALDLIRDCVHCGFCLPTCPSYAVFEDEMDSPRGRILLMRIGHEEGAEISPEMVTHFDRCLGCMACVTACPSGRPVRPADREHPAAARAPGDRACTTRAVRRGIFELFTHPGRLRALAPLHGARAAARPARPPRERPLVQRGPRLRVMLSLTPDVPARAAVRRLPAVTKARGPSARTRRASCRAASSASGSPTSTPPPSASSPPRAWRSTRRRSRAAAARSSCTRASRTRRSRSPARRSPPTRATTRSSPTSPAAARR